MLPLLEKRQIIERGNPQTYHDSTFTGQLAIFAELNTINQRDSTIHSTHLRLYQLNRDEHTARFLYARRYRTRTPTLLCTDVIYIYFISGGVYDLHLSLTLNRSRRQHWRAGTTIRHNERKLTPYALEHPERSA